MKALIFSDSHGCTSPMRRALLLHPDAEVVFFLGDGVWDLDRVAAEDYRRAYYAVRGNNDFGAHFRGEPVEKLVQIDLLGRKILLTHGDLYGARYGTEGLCALARAKGADILLFGHTHTPYESFVPAKDGSAPFYLFNPGAILPGYGEPSHYGVPSHYGILTLDEKTILFSHGEIG